MCTLSNNGAAVAYGKLRENRMVALKASLETENEAAFFGRLIVALLEHEVFPQLALASLIEAAARAYSACLRIAQPRADDVFLVAQMPEHSVVSFGSILSFE